MTIRNIFKQSVSDLNKSNEKERPKGDLTPNEKKQLFLRTKMYVILQEIMEELSQNFEENEAIAGYLAFSNEENSTSGTMGWAGMMQVTTPRGRDYLNTFHELRGHRLLVFTNKKMYFMVVLEYIEKNLFYTYDYHTIEKIKFKKNQTSYREWRSVGRFEKEESIHYTLDFQAGNRIFTEILTEKDGETFLDLREKIPALKAIEITEKATRNSPFSYVFSNINFSVKTLTILSWLFFGALFLYFVYVVVQVYFLTDTIKTPDLSNLHKVSDEGIQHFGFIFRMLF